MSEERIKILILGPPKCGKTCIANYLSNYMDTPTQTYKPTVGLRILDYEPENLQLGKGSKVTVELWDQSGNDQFKSCWPAAANGAHGILFVFNIEEKEQLGELQRWHKKFRETDGIREEAKSFVKVADEHCLVLAHRSTQPQGNLKTQKPKLPGKLQRLKCITSSLDYQMGDNWKGEFDEMVRRIVMNKRHEEEQAILNSQMDGTVPIREGH